MCQWRLPNFKQKNYEILMDVTMHRLTFTGGLDNLSFAETVCFV
jgi:hypothetical protein